MSIAGYAGWPAYDTFLIVLLSGRPVYDPNPLRPNPNPKKPVSGSCRVHGLGRTLTPLLLYVFSLVMAIYNLSHNLLNNSCGHEHVTRNFLKNRLHPWQMLMIFRRYSLHFGRYSLSSLLVNFPSFYIEFFLYQKFKKYCLGKLRSSPWSELDGLRPETRIINEQLGKIITKGFLTVNSQPAVNGEKSDSPSVGE